MDIKTAKQEVKEWLFEFGLRNRISANTVNHNRKQFGVDAAFYCLPTGTVTVTIHDWEPSEILDILDERATELGFELFVEEKRHFGM